MAPPLVVAVGIVVLVGVVGVAVDVVVVVVATGISLVATLSVLPVLCLLLLLLSLSLSLSLLLRESILYASIFMRATSEYFYSLFLLGLCRNVQKCEPCQNRPHSFRFHDEFSLRLHTLLSLVW